MNKKILVIDDHPETLDIIQQVLTEHGYHVITAASGSEGLAKAESEAPHLILIDGVMPEIDGWTVCRRLRQSPRHAHTPLILFSATNDPAQKLAGFDAGANDYLVKPTEPDELLERIKDLLQPRSPDANEAFKTEEVMSPKIQPPVTPQDRAHAGQLIVVLGTRGGVGTTTVAMNLAASLASQGQETLLVDMDLQQGHIALYLNQPVKQGLHNLTEETAVFTAAKTEQLASTLAVHHDHKLRLVLTQGDLFAQQAPPPKETTSDLFQHWRQNGTTIVVDGGHGVLTPLRAIIETADHILLCLQPERIALTAARRLILNWRKTLAARTVVSPILLDFSEHNDLPRQPIEQFIGQPLTAVWQQPLFRHLHGDLCVGMWQ